MKSAAAITLVLMLCLVYCCSNEKASGTRLDKPAGSTDTLPAQRNAAIAYRFQRMDSSFRSLILKPMHPDSLRVILYLNRADRKHLLRMDTVVLPSPFHVNTLLYTPFPDSIPSISTVHKILYFSYYLQAFAAYQKGRLIRWGPVSMGKASTPTPTGLMHTNWRSKRTVSTVNSDWIMNWYFNLDNKLGVSMHEYDLPGYPASHACMRLLKEDALWLYQWSESWILENPFQIKAYGTPVLVFGTYPFGELKPWLRLNANGTLLSFSNTFMDSITLPYYPLILNRQNTRDSVVQSFTR